MMLDALCIGIMWNGIHVGLRRAAPAEPGGVWGGGGARFATPKEACFNRRPVPPVSQLWDLPWGAGRISRRWSL
jgi:hypothetical protein